MNTHRLSTTISKRHWDILNRYTEKYNTQQKVIERALENLEKGTEDIPRLTREEELWLRWNRDMKNGLVVMQKDIGKFFMENTDIELFKKYVAENKSQEFAYEFYYQKPLKQCSLREIVEGIIIAIQFQGGHDSVFFKEEEDRFLINITHSMGLNVSKIIVIMNESMLKSYGAKFHINFSERHIFFDIDKEREGSDGSSTPIKKAVHEIKGAGT